MAAESRQCSGCKNFDTLVPLKDPASDALWVEHEGQMFAIKQLRCIACGLSDLVTRDFVASQEGIRPAPGQAAASDGRLFAVHPISKPPTHEEKS